MEWDIDLIIVIGAAFFFASASSSPPEVSATREFFVDVKLNCSMNLNWISWILKRQFRLSISPSRSCLRSRSSNGNSFLLLMVRLNLMSQWRTAPIFTCAVILFYSNAIVGCSAPPRWKPEEWKFARVEYLICEKFVLSCFFHFAHFHPRQMKRRKKKD